MVDTQAEQFPLPPSTADRDGPTATSEAKKSGRWLRTFVRRRTGRVLGVVVVTMVGVAASTAVLAGTSARASTPTPKARAAVSAPRPATHRTAAAVPTAVTTTTTAAAPQPRAVVAPAPVSPAAVSSPLASIGTLVEQVEAAGIEPGPNWTWSIGDTAAHCGAIADAASGCTYWVSGVERTVFSGSPSLALVAHELANAETESDAVPSLMAQVATSEAGTSWSTTDAVSSCLVEHFLGFQDDAAGSWQCPVALASYVADHIHDQVVTTETKAVCGTASGVSSTLTFTADAGTLTVTGPTGGPAPQTAPAGGSVTVSGIGTFIAVDQGGTVGESGLCQA